MNEKEYLKIKNEEKDFSVKKRWFKHKETGEYEFRIPLFDINDYDEIKE